jgi:hypothetical protein
VTRRAINVLALGSLGPNQDRILALQDRVRRLVYAYTEFHPNLIRLEPRITCVPLARRNLAAQVRYLIAAHGITVAYSLLNASDGSTEATLELLDGGIDVPIVRHYKEHPCSPTLEERRVLLESSGQIYINTESFEYFRATYGVPVESAHIMDADMIAERYMTDHFTSKTRCEDGAPHLLVAGGMSMLEDRLDVRSLCVEMNKRRVHVHLYGYMMTEIGGRSVVGDAATREAYESLASQLPYVHLHDYVQPESFCAAWSRYDAGFMHPRVPSNDKAARFEEMNLPYRYTAYLTAGLPLAVPAEGQSAMKRLAEQEAIGIIYSDYSDLAEQLYDSERMSRLATTARENRRKFSFEHSADELVRVLSRYAAVA